jgi:hypothetical protein
VDDLREARGLGCEDISSGIGESVVAPARIVISPAWAQFPNPSKLNELLQIVVQRAGADFVYTLRLPCDFLHDAVAMEVFPGQCEKHVQGCRGQWKI